MRPMILAALLPLAACNMAGGDDGEGAPATGTGNQRTFAVADFTSVELIGPDDVTVQTGPAFAVRAEGDPEVLERLKVERRDGALRIGRVNGAFNWERGSKGVKVHVTMPRITEANLLGAGDFTIDRAEGPSFKGFIAGSGDMSIGQVAAQKVELSLAGAGSITAAGRADDLDVSIAGAGDVEAAGLTASNAKVSIAGAGGVKATVDGPASIRIMGSGDVDLGPKAKCRTVKMGSGNIRCGG